MDRSTAGRMTSLLWLLVCLVTSSKANYYVHQTTSPTEVQPHLTTDLIINCTVLWNDTADARIPLSLTIKKSTMRSPNNYTIVAIINSIEKKLEPKFSMNASLTGHMSPTSNDSYLAVHWLYPQFEMTGNYVCELLGFDGMGQPITVNDTAKVTDHKPNQNDALKKIQDHDKQIAALQAQLAKLQVSGSTLDKLANTMFVHSQTVNKTKYMLSRPFLRNSAMAESICHLFDGYLVEFDLGLTEYMTVKSVLRNASSNIYYDIQSVLVGVTDELSEGTWRFRDHLKQSIAPYLNWGHSPQQPDGGDKENCAELVKADNWLMADVPCYDNAAHVHFMCEVKV